MPKGIYIRIVKHKTNISKAMNGNKNALKKRQSESAVDIIEKMKEEQVKEQNEYIKTVIRFFVGDNNNNGNK